MWDGKTESLREWAAVLEDSHSALLREAADEIDRLRARPLPDLEALDGHLPVDALAALKATWDK
jgi:hypothetical protein